LDIFEGVDRNLAWTSLGGPKLLQLVIIVVVFGVVLGLIARSWSGTLAKWVVTIGFLTIFYFWIMSL
jgi:hypothetical protein